MKVIAKSLRFKWLGGLIVFLSAVASLTACSSISPTKNSGDQSRRAIEIEDLEKLKAAEYQDYMTAMDFEETHRKLGNYYAAKGMQVHSLIDQMEGGKQVNEIEVSRALDDSDSAKYDDRPPLSLDDESRSGY